MLASFYAGDALVRIIDRNNPPSKPQEIKGKAAIGKYWEDICGRVITHKIVANITEGNRIAFTQACAYPDGAKVFSQSMLDLKNGAISQHTMGQAWDE